MVHKRRLSIPQHLTTQGAKTTTLESGRLRSDMLLEIVVFGLMHVCECLRVCACACGVRVSVCMFWILFARVLLNSTLFCG